MSDYHYATDCSARNWVYHPYFVLYNNLDQGIGWLDPPTLKTWLRPCWRHQSTNRRGSRKHKFDTCLAQSQSYWRLLL